MRTLALLAVAGWLGACVGPVSRTPETYVVQPRDTLYSIAWRHDLDYRELARWNHIGPDYRIRVGQILMLRASASAGAAARGAPASGGSAPRAPSASEPASVPPAAAGETAGQPCSRGDEADEVRAAGRWMWPTLQRSPPRPVPGGGILLLGEIGQPIRAACAGRVVYAGSGIRGYGNLIIIKHGASMLSAYAHALDMSVHEGQWVAGGEPIGHMGTGPNRIAALYFEIRSAGKPVDPLAYLPHAR